MCGVSGIINFDGQPVDQSLVNGMMRAMKHRGPDDEGIFLDKNIGLGFVRLSIIDLTENGHQPMRDSSGRYIIIYNGEIYNYVEIKSELAKKGYYFNSSSDTEVVLKSYIEWGEDCLNHFNGMWSFCIYDLKKEFIFISRDRYGIKPLYYYYDDNRFIFASEIGSILKAVKSKFSPNQEAIYNYLVYNRTDYNNSTFFNEINKVEAGYCAKIFLNNKHIDKKIISERKYKRVSKFFFIRKWYDLKKRVNEAKPFQNSDEYKDFLFSSIDLRLRSDVPVGVSLSGGLDSSSILSRLIHKKLDLNTFSAVYGENLKGDETNYILEFKNLVQKMNFVQISENDLYKDLDKLLECHSSEPFVDTSIYASFKVFEEAQKKIKVTLNGQGADEQLGGYMYFWGHYLKYLLKNGSVVKFSSELFNNFKNQKNLSTLKFLLYYLSSDSFKLKYRLRSIGYLNSDFLNSQKGKSDIIKLIDNSSSLQDSFLIHFKHKLQHLLKWEDINSMHFSLESRLPFLDYRLVEKTLALKEQEILYKGQTKHILRKAMSGYLPEKIRVRKDKVGFETPADKWFRNENYQKTILKILQSNNFNKMEIIDNKKALNLYENHLMGKINISREIWKWINLDYWFKKHIN